MMSGGPPAGDDTMSLIGRSGKACAQVRQSCATNRIRAVMTLCFMMYLFVPTARKINSFMNGFCKTVGWAKGGPRRSVQRSDAIRRAHARHCAFAWERRHTRSARSRTPRPPLPSLRAARSLMRQFDGTHDLLAELFRWSMRKNSDYNDPKVRATTRRTDLIAHVLVGEPVPTPHRVRAGFRRNMRQGRPPR